MKRIIFSQPIRGSFPSVHELTKPARDTNGDVYPVGWKFSIITSDIEKRELRVRDSNGSEVVFR